ncbi:MAG: DNA polymerase IV, partial [Desulfobacteraceae bacterium]
YEARKFGIHSAMPIFQAKQRCPRGIFLPVRMSLYQSVSDRIMTILKDFSPILEPVSIDEAYLDLSGLEKLMGSPPEVAHKIKSRIKQEAGLTCSIGIAPNKFLAKIASELRKPDGLTILTAEEIPAFIQTLSIKKVPGVGPKTLETLEKLGIRCLGDVSRVSLLRLEKHLGKFSRRLRELAQGIDDSKVIPYSAPKSISTEETLIKDSADKELLKIQLLAQSETVAKRLRQNKFKGKTIVLKLKQSDFKLLTRSVTLEQATDSAQIIFKQGLQMLEKSIRQGPFRLIGIGLANLYPVDLVPQQIELFADPKSPEKTWDPVEKAMDLIQDRFGGEAISRGCFIKKKARSSLD